MIESLLAGVCVIIIAGGFIWIGFIWEDSDDDIWWH